jgi:parallel beta-helix repeat protein
MRIFRQIVVLTLALPSIVWAAQGKTRLSGLYTGFGPASPDAQAAWIQAQSRYLSLYAQPVNHYMTESRAESLAQWSNAPLGSIWLHRRPYGTDYHGYVKFYDGTNRELAMITPSTGKLASGEADPLWGDWRTSFKVVRDYGTAQTSAVLQTAITSLGSTKRTLYVPAGTYSVTENLTFPSTLALWFEQGAVLSVAAGDTVTISGPVNSPQTQIFAGDGTILWGGGQSVLTEYWGAVGDSVTTDSLAFQKAVASGASVHLLPGRVYHITGTGTTAQKGVVVLSYEGQRLWSEGATIATYGCTTRTVLMTGNKTVVSGINFVGDGITNDLYNAAIRVLGASDALITGCSFRDLDGGGVDVNGNRATVDANHFDNSSALYSGGGDFGAVTVWTNDCIVSNNVITNSEASGICLFGADRTVVSNNQVSANDGSTHSMGIYLLNGANDNIITGNYIENCYAEGIPIGGTTNTGNVIIGNRIHNCKYNGIGMNAAAGSYNRNTVISNNIIDNANVGAATTDAGIELRGTDHTTITGNTIKGCVTGIRTNDTDNSYILITGNTVDSSISYSGYGGHGIIMYGRKHSILGNVITRAENYGMYVNWTDEVLISDNHVDSCDVGIYVGASATNTQFADNLFGFNATADIQNFSGSGGGSSISNTSPAVSATWQDTLGVDSLSWSDVTITHNSLNYDLFDGEAESLTNPGFETGDLTGWTKVGTPTVDEVTSAEKYGGTYSYHLQSNGGGNNQGRSQPITLQSSTTYILSARVKCLTQTSAMRIMLSWVDGVAGPQYAATYVTADSLWTYYTLTTATFGGSTTSAYLYVLGQGEAYFDDVRLHNITDPIPTTHRYLTWRIGDYWLTPSDTIPDLANDEYLIAVNDGGFAKQVAAPLRIPPKSIGSRHMADTMLYVSKGFMADSTIVANKGVQFPVPTYDGLGVPPTDANCDASYPAAAVGMVGLMRETNAGIMYMVGKKAASDWWYVLMTATP